MKSSQTAGPPAWSVDPKSELAVPVYIIWTEGVVRIYQSDCVSVRKWRETDHVGGDYSI